MAAFDELKSMLKEAKDTPPVPLTNCPVCGWTLTKNRGTGELHCVYCGWPLTDQAMVV